MSKRVTSQVQRESAQQIATERGIKYKSALRTAQRHTPSGAKQKYKTLSEKSLTKLTPETREKFQAKIKEVKTKIQPRNVVSRTRQKSDVLRQAADRYRGGDKRVKINARFRVADSSKDRRQSQNRSVRLDLTEAEINDIFAAESLKHVSEILKNSKDGAFIEGIQNLQLFDF